MLIRRALFAALSMSFALPALAQDDLACDDTVEVDRFRLYRQLSLDLRGRIPSLEELRALPDELDLEAVVDEMLDGEEFESVVRRHHADMLWPTAEVQDIVNPAVNLLLPAQFYEGGGDPNRLFLIIPGIVNRGGIVPCKDEPAEWDEDGNLVFEDYGDGTQREGWVMVEPYWAPGTEVKVCALEAQIASVANDGADCEDVNGMGAGNCGCGPRLERCLDFMGAQQLTDIMQEQLMQMLVAPIKAGGNYTEAFSRETEPVNGPLVHYYRYLARYATDPIILEAPVATDDLPDLEWADTTWVDVPRRSDAHSGILTSMSFLLRFQTARARANTFYNAFLCQPFVAPAGGLPSPNDDCSNEPNLRERCGCDYCHSSLEPAAAYWGRFADAGTLFLDPEDFPTYLARCAQCARSGLANCDFICERFYVSEIGHEKQEAFAGVQKAYEFRGEDEVENLEAGPRALMEKVLTDGSLARCSARQLFSRLYRRDPTQQEALFLIPELAADFTAGDYDFKSLVRALVLDPTYRRMVR